MTAAKCLFLLLAVALSAGYGWGMRGTVIGGEKGAMLPGMYIGLILALFSGGEIGENYLIPAAAGLMGMTFGGIEPYGDTISLVFDEEHIDRKKGLVGLALKGALWFSVYGGITGISFSAMGGRYKPLQLVLLCILIPVFQAVGYKIFNTPFDPENGLMPKISFAYESREEWGSNAGVLLVLIVFCALSGDTLALKMLAGGFIGGAVGWLLGMLGFSCAEYRKKGENFVFGNLHYYIGGWKIMEFTLGTVGGLGLALGYLTGCGEIADINRAMAEKGIFSPLGDYEIHVALAFSFIFFVLLLINLYEFILDRKGIKYNGFILDCFERPFFNLIPLVFVLLCSVTAARLMTGFMLIYALFLKNSFDRYKKDRNYPVVIIVYALAAGAALFADIALGGFPAKWLFFIGGLPYWLSEQAFILQHRAGGSLKNLIKRKDFATQLLMLGQIIIINTAAFILL